MAAAASHEAIDGTGERLRQAALELFSQDGYHGVSLRRLASVVGLLPGSLYNHFEGKQELLFELIEDYELEVLQLFKAAACKLRARQAPQALLADYLLLVQAQQASAQVAHHEFRHLTPRQQTCIRGIRRQQVQALSAVLRCKGREQSLALEGLAQLLLALPPAQADDAVASGVAGLIVELVRP
ncbi:MULTISPECIES: TetR/AcrR family transcriptional regulator [unclassified Pseudomonas]|uniref:TetR/AcrR family transcriptional regulator n=1 Tax=unclassified Pseudomonas TaxID=196821 RepID=UPI00235E6A75|nr:MULTISPECIES: TetR/AcrR family transcriptional regulator [unclassified Pseudomonas]